MTISREAFISLFKPFGEAPASVIEELVSRSESRTIPAGTTIYHPGDACDLIGFVLEGEIRVYRIGESGREITLYEIFPGETCILNASCLLSHFSYPALADATTDVKLLLVPGDLFRRLVDEEPVMRRFVLSLFSDRLGAIMELVEDVAFGSMDRRLTDYLVEKSDGGTLQVTHQAIANDLGSSREVISRLLKDFERQGKVALTRNRIDILNL